MEPKPRNVDAIKARESSLKIFFFSVPISLEVVVVIS
jgi:hypothetical protein